MQDAKEEMRKKEKEKQCMVIRLKEQPNARNAYIRGIGEGTPKMFSFKARHTPPIPPSPNISASARKHSLRGGGAGMAASRAMADGMQRRQLRIPSTSSTPQTKVSGCGGQPGTYSVGANCSRKPRSMAGAPA